LKGAKLVSKVVIDNMLVNPNIFFAISPSQSVTAFRSEIGQKNLAGLRILASCGSGKKYKQCCGKFGPAWWFSQQTCRMKTVELRSDGQVRVNSH
jgi:hypothetical protein